MPGGHWVSHIAGYAGTCEDINPSASGPTLPPLVTWIVVGSVPDGVAEAPSSTWRRRLELPSVLEVAAA
jgi:hypothetical protein